MSERRSFGIQLVGVFLLAAAFTGIYQFQTEHIVGYDGYFHIKYAEMLRDQGVFQQFDRAARSMWSDRFSDKELLFHVLLIPFTMLDNPATGAKLATVLLAALTLTSFFAVLRLNGVRYPFLWLVVLAGSGPLFFYRLQLPRPHLLAVLLLLWCVHCILNERRVVLGVLCFVYALSYTGFHLPLLLSLIAGIADWTLTRRLDWKTPATILGALVAGVLVHPNFPTNLHYFYVQNIYVLAMAVERPDLAMGLEFDGLDSRDTLASAFVVISLYFAAFFTALVRPRRLPPKTVVLFVLSLSLMLLTMVVRRFAEYSIPLTLFFTASFFSVHLQDVEMRRLWQAGGRTRSRLVGIVLLVLTALGLMHWRSFRQIAPSLAAAAPAFEEAAGYLREHAEPDELVFTCDWDETPELLYFNERNRYLVFLDPNFMYYRDPDYWERWSSLARGGYGGYSYNVLAEEFRYGVCSKSFSDLQRIVEQDPRMEVVLETERVFVFHLLPGNPEISLDEFLNLGPS